jgi:hypothetical protein
MATKEAMDKLRAVLDYIPEEAARRLPGDEQDYYDALTRRIHRTVAVKSMVRRRVIVTQAEDAEEPEPVDAPAWQPPPPVEEPPAWTPEPAAEPAPEAAPEALPEEPAAESAVSLVEATSVVEAVEGEPGTEPAEGGAGRAEDFFDVVKRAPGRVDMEPVEPDITLSEKEWGRLEQRLPQREPEPEPAPESDADAGSEEVFEEIVLPGEGAPLPLAAEVGAAEGELEPSPEPEATAEFEVEQVEEGPEEPTAVGEFEILEEEEAVGEEGEEPPYQVNEFTLYRRDARTRGGKTRSTYFFAAEPPEGAKPSALPEGFEVIVNEQTGIPVVRKATARVLPVIEIEGLGPVMASRLEKVGVRTTKDLLRIDARGVSAETGISERLLGNFRAMAELLQVHGVYPDQAAAMVYAGIRSIGDLSVAAPVELARSMNQAAKDHQLKLRGKVAPARVRAWQERAKKL